MFKWKIRSIGMESGSILKYSTTSPDRCKLEVTRSHRYELYRYELGSVLQIQTWIDHNSKSTSPNATKFSQELAYHLENVHDRSRLDRTKSRSMQIRFVSITDRVQTAWDRSRGPTHVREEVFRDLGDIFAAYAYK